MKLTEREHARRHTRGSHAHVPCELAFVGNGDMVQQDAPHKLDVVANGAVLADHRLLDTALVAARETLAHQAITPHLLEQDLHARVRARVRRATEGAVGAGRGRQERIGAMHLAGIISTHLRILICVPPSPTHASAPSSASPWLRTFQPKPDLSSLAVFGLDARVRVCVPSFPHQSCLGTRGGPTTAPRAPCAAAARSSFP